MPTPQHTVKENGTGAPGETPNTGVTKGKQLGVLEREVSWNAPVIEANTVHKTLQTLWTEIAEERRAASKRPRALSDAALMRTRTINLIAIAGNRADAEQIKATVTDLTEFFPSRTMILIRRESNRVPTGLSVSVSVEERPAPHKQTPVRFETITVSAGSGREELLASVASPVLVPELPDFVWCPSAEFVDSALLQELLPITDRLIVDTSLVHDPSATLQFLANLASGPFGEQLHLSDIAWTRLTPWRQMIAQFFDQASTQPCLTCIDEVTLEYGATGHDSRSGLTAALLIAGWLCTRLGWRAPGEELVRSKDGWKLTLRAGERGRSREVILTLKQTDDPSAGHCIGSVNIEAHGDFAGNFRVARISPESVETLSENHTKVSRIVYLRNLDDSRLLSLELRVFGVDPTYVDALNFAAKLWPEGVII